MIDLAEVQQSIEEKVPVAQFLGLTVEHVEPGHARLRLPFARPAENHLGIAYAGAIFALAEITGGVVMLSAFDTNDVTVLIRRIEIDFVRPSRRDLFCDLYLSDERIADARTMVAAQGAADISVPIDVTDPRGRVIARVQADYYLRSV